MCSQAREQFAYSLSLSLDGRRMPQFLLDLALFSALRRFSSCSFRPWSDIVDSAFRKHTMNHLKKSLWVRRFSAAMSTILRLASSGSRSKQFFAS